uniref:Lysine (K)-specific demethylase 7Ab n=1 Tax=Hucho hucho TaxID=62062 RepID=A0A4W5PT91_9TELE
MAAAPLYCVCRQSYDVSRFMIECDICNDWFHGSCVQVEEHHAMDIDVYHCPKCDVQHGPSLMKKRNNWHRHDYTEADDGSRPVQAGTSVFVRELQNRTFPSADEIMVQMQGHQVTQKYLEKQGFRYPITVPKLDGLGLKLPPSSFSVRNVEEYVGGDKIVDVIDVARQADSKMKLREFVKYYYKPHRPKVLNVISLEFSDTKMAELVVVPDIAQKMSWVENYWPDDSFFPKPFVQKYCLMGVKDSYTDFHIDFGGTSVWYHVLWGEKIFYLIKPTQANLALYEAWSSSPNQSEVFFGDKVDKCYKCLVPQGTTVLIPTGWIHAVLTSQDCMAFGGNFLHNLNIGMQLRCYEMERRLKTPDLFKFPYFEAICWYVAKNLLETLKELREDNCQPPAYLTEGVKALITALKNWLKREVTEPASEVPDHIRPNRLIKELTKEIRYLEVSKPMKSQGSGACPLTRLTLDRASHHAHRTARRLRHHHHHHHAPKTPSNLEILELHTRQVLKRLEVGPFEEDAPFSSTVTAKFNKASVASAAAVERSLDNNLRLADTSDSGSSDEEDKEQCRTERGTGSVTDLHQASHTLSHHHKPLKGEHPTSPTTEEEAVEGMLSMAGLLYPQRPEESSTAQEPWWSNLGKSSGSNSSEAWGDQSPSRAASSQDPSSGTDYQYCETTLSPPLHPSKRSAPNTPPISNQATKGKRPKKGMATTKQRLGKILKLSRNNHFLMASEDAAFCYLVFITSLGHCLVLV